MMKHTEPKINIACFSKENIVTESIVTESDSTLLEPHVSSSIDAYGRISYSDSQKTGAVLQFE